MKNSIVTFWKNLSVIICLLIGVNNVYAQVSSDTPGDWNVGTNWTGDAVPGNVVVNINHTMNINIGLNLSSGAVYSFNANSSGAGNLNLGSGSVVHINADVTFNGSGNNLNGGVIYVHNGHTLTINSAINEAGTSIIIEEGASFIITGNLTNNGGNIQVDGSLAVTGHYDGQNKEAQITGSGSFTTTGHMVGMNGSTVFGVPNPNCSGGCSGRDLAGNGCINYNRPATINPASTSSCLGASVNFTATFDASGLTVEYQWESRTLDGVYAPILGATLVSYTASPSVSTVYRIKVSSKLNSGDDFCYTYSTGVTITVTSCPNNWTGTTSTAWNLASNWSLGSVPTNTSTVIIPATVTSTRMPEISATFNIGSLENNGTITSAGSSTLNVYGNIINNGTITTAPSATSTINMVGTTAQTIGGTSPTTIQNLNINNLAGVSLLNDLTINGTLSLTSGVLTTNNNLTINFNLGGNIGYSASDAGSILGNVSGVRNLSDRSHYISVPFEGITSGDINTSTPIQSGAGYWLMSSKKYDTQGWTAITNTVTNLSPVSGYSLAMFSPATITMTGSYTHGATYNSGDYANTIPVAMTNGVYFMIGNPYPSTLDWDNESGWTKTNINDAIYFWNPTTNSVASYVDGAQTNGGTRYIPAMQAFLVKVTGIVTEGDFASVAVNNNARVLTATPATYFRTSSNQLARLLVKNAAGTMVDETVVRADDVATCDFDSDADASKIKGGLALYTKTVGSTEEYSINTLPITGPEMLVPLNLKVSVAGLYTIECSEYSVPGYSLILEDKQTASYTLLDNSTVYTINANTTDNTDRFVLRFRAGLTTGVVSGNSSTLQISTYDNQLMLNAGAVQTDKGTIRIYDASGLAVMELKDQSIVSGIQVIALPGLTQGLYIAKIEVDGTTYVGKVVLK